MDYKLALELKKAGFAEDKDVPDTQSSPSGKGDWLYGPRGIPSDEMVYIPTLSELIEACGEDFNVLSTDPYNDNVKTKWGAYSMSESDKERVSGFGSTPEESVAHLYLALHPKHTTQT